jgi:4'-phosphopantetheinyl transferase
MTHVWSAALDIGTDTLKACRALLSKEENDRASRYYFEQDTVHYIAARGFLRSLLAQHLSANPEQIIFDYGLHGKPILTQEYNLQALNFNLSHSGGIALCAISYKRNVGIDIERKRHIKDWKDVAQSCLAKEELETLIALPKEECSTGFLKLWTQKEAYIKALGQGLSYPLQQFCIHNKSGEASIVVYDRHDPQQQGRWEFHDIHITNDHIATLVVEGAGTQVQLNTWLW